MESNIAESSIKVDNGSVDNNSEEKPVVTPVVTPQRKYALNILTFLLNILAYILIGATVGISLLFSLLNGLPLGATPLHIVLCVIGYQLLMAVAILSLSPSNGLTTFLTLRDKRRVHTILQVVGSILAIAGSFVKIIDKTNHWTSLHGIFALVALVFTTVSLVNGLTSLYAFEWRRWIPGNLSKLTHICFGAIAFIFSSLSLCYGFDKGFFRIWATDAYTNTLIVFTGTFTFIVIVNPVLTFYSKSMNIIRK